MLVKGPRYNIIHSHWCNHNVTLVLMTQPRWISVDEFYMDPSKQENLPQKSIAFHNTENVKEWFVLQCFRMFRLKHITHENSICVWFICSQEPLLPRKAIGCKRYISSNPICGFARCATGISDAGYKAIVRNIIYSGVWDRRWTTCVLCYGPSVGLCF